MKPSVVLGHVGWLIFALISPLCYAQTGETEVRIQVNLNHELSQLPSIWNDFGYDEPNYTYSPNGKKLLHELAALDATPVYIRVHNLLTSGDGSASLKWGSTNVYTEDSFGRPIYTWTILDQIFDAFLSTGVKPLVEIGFMPEALSTHPRPYRHDFPRTSVSEIYTGWAYPPRDYRKWSELVFQFVHHLRERYGDSEVKTWLWEVWNEPDIDYWKGTREEFFKLYDVTVEATLRALPGAFIGGPDSTGPGNSRAADFLRAFLEHCAHGNNYVNGARGSQLDFISFHPKGSPTWQKDHVEMGIQRQLAAIEEGFQIVASFPEWRTTPIILGESDPEGCAACSAKDHPQNSYRNGPLYGTYTVEVMDRVLELAQEQHINFRGAVTWAFEFEGQPYFAGFRELATNGVDKPVLNAFRMLGLLGKERLTVNSSAAMPLNDVLRTGVRTRPDINAIAARKDRELEVLVWNYHDDDVPFPPAMIAVEIAGLPSDAKHVLLEHFRIDREHSNAFAMWQEMGSPQLPTDDQYHHLESAGQLQLLDSPRWAPIHEGELRERFLLPRQGMSLLRLSW